MNLFAALDYITKLDRGKSPKYDHIINLLESEGHNGECSTRTKVHLDF